MSRQILIISITSFILAQIAVVATWIYLHRAVAHRSLSLRPVTAIVFRAVLWLLTGQSRQQWVAVHRKHHTFTDREGDPHSPLLLGFWRVQLWNVYYYIREARNPDTVREVRPRRLRGLVGTARLLPRVDRAGPRRGAREHGHRLVARAAGHDRSRDPVHVRAGPADQRARALAGRPEFGNTAYNSRVLAGVTAGESLHNNHHAFPRSPKFSLRRSELDPSWIAIRVLAVLRLVVVLGPSGRARAASRARSRRIPPLPEEWGTMALDPLDLTFGLSARARFDVVELRSRLPIDQRDALASYPRCLYWSAHTTAGFLDRSLTARLGPGRVPTYVEALRRIFPEGAGYAHDWLECRQDLDAAQRAVEPRNGDSHLAFIAGGLRPCVTYPNRPGEAVCFVDLDGINDGRPRRRLTRVIGFHREAVVAQMRLSVPMSRHPIDSVNLKDPKLGVYDQLSEFVARTGVGKGRLHIALEGGRARRSADHQRIRDAPHEIRPDVSAAQPAPIHGRGVPGTRSRTRALFPAKPSGTPGAQLNCGLDTLGLAGLPLRESARPHGGRSGRPGAPHSAIHQLARGRTR